MHGVTVEHLRTVGADIETSRRLGLDARLASHHRMGDCRAMKNLPDRSWKRVNAKILENTLTNPGLVQFALVLLIAFFAAGCLTLMGGEQRVGDEAARQVEAEMGVVDDPKLESWIDEIGRRLVAKSDRSDREFRFKIIDMAAPNAFALPGGHIYVSRGLLALVNSEDELAGVIGHEIGHVTGQHAASRINLSAPFKVITGLTGWVTGILTPRIGEAIQSGGDTLTDGLLIAPYGRQQERDADRIGLKLAAAAGWDPMGLSRFLHTLGREDELRSGGPRRSNWLDSHPATPERVADTKKRAVELERAEIPPIVPSRSALLAKLDGLLVGEDAAAGLVVDGLFVQPVLGFTLGIPSGWPYQNSPTQLIAAPEDGGAAMLLRLVAEGDDPAAVVAELEEKLRTPPDTRDVSLGGLKGVRMRVDQRTRDGRMTFDVTYFSAKGLILEVTGIAPQKDFERWAPIFDAAIARIRTPTTSDIASLLEARLRSVQAREGESLSRLAERADSDWAADRLAVVNGLDAGASLKDGFGVKLMRKEPYSLHAK
jgi:predicted Zn-dependent protease